MSLRHISDKRALVLALPLARLELDPLTLCLLGEHYELSTAEDV
jgi:hypothetical protein